MVLVSSIIKILIYLSVSELTCILLLAYKQEGGVKKQLVIRQRIDMYCTLPILPVLKQNSVFRM